MIESSFVLNVTQAESPRPETIVELFPGLSQAFELSESNHLSMYTLGKNPYYDDPDLYDDVIAISKIPEMEVDDVVDAISIIATISEKSWVSRQFRDYFSDYYDGDEYFLHSFQFCIARSPVVIEDSYDESCSPCRTNAFISFAGDGSMKRRNEFYEKFVDSDLSEAIIEKVYSVVGKQASWAGVYQT